MNLLSELSATIVNNEESGNLNYKTQMHTI